jgi:hypothetical protein
MLVSTAVTYNRNGKVKKKLKTLEMKLKVAKLIWR